MLFTKVVTYMHLPIIRPVLLHGGEVLQQKKQVLEITMLKLGLCNHYWYDRLYII